ncbi:MAG: ribonuclease PH [Candidatus Aminicenantes bacterium]|nr:MAG: ribonuclease PH [Candidatus Aminicenantes bacterium]
MREDNRSADTIRPLSLTPDYLDFADGSALIEVGKTKVVAGATIEEKVPSFLKGSGKGWITAEYAMLPCSTEKRTPRERGPGRMSGRTQEIQRLIGRSLRTVTDLGILGERTITIDCDIIQADGGTRTASVTAGCVALALALKKMMDEGTIDEMPLQNLVSAVSVGIVDGNLLLDLDYKEDSSAEVDMNVIKTDTGKIVEIQATAEKSPFTKKDFNALLGLADKGIKALFLAQKEILKQRSLLFMAYG